MYHHKPKKNKTLEGLNLRGYINLRRTNPKQTTSWNKVHRENAPRITIPTRTTPRQTKLCKDQTLERPNSRKTKLLKGKPLEGQTLEAQSLEGQPLGRPNSEKTKP